ncbi:transposase [Bradyrhizobium sp. UFLA 03-164]|uniref:Transposase n=1 Tax=Bradyrhizobium uaiense TaxID=2594946 RepID=A0A6P1BXC4_9BRAD|nr:transposase [Bradyrhizobium uaiense]NEV02919.1 transposase [Bradyrhizobium uaiense]
MISFGPMVRVFVATQPIDFRKGVHGLVALVAEGIGGKLQRRRLCLPIEAIGSFEATGF